MGSSAKKKREKKKDFQKAKLKVGKARPKAVNHTDTSFRAKAIVLNQQLSVDAPSAINQFQHYVSLLSSRTDSQRRESLAYLASYIGSNPNGASLPITTSGILDKLCPLILDGTSSVRLQLLKLFQVLPVGEIQDHVTKILPYVRAGMTHLSKEIRISAVDFLSWMITVAGTEIVSCAGGWVRTLECFTTLLSWRSADTGKWISNKASLGDAKSTARVIVVLSELVRAGLTAELLANDLNTTACNFPIWHLDFHAMPTKSDAYAYLSLFGSARDDENQIMEDTEDRIRVYNDKFRSMVEAGIAACKQEGGELGRAAGGLVKVLEVAPK